LVMVSTKHFIFMFSFKDFWFCFYHQDLFLVFFVLFLVFFLGNAHTTSWIINHHGIIIELVNHGLACD